MLRIHRRRSRRSPRPCAISYDRKQVRLVWPPRTLAAQVLLGVLSILLVTTAFGGFLYVTLSNQNLDRQTEQQALGIAETVAQMPDVRAALLAGDPKGLFQRRAQEVRGASVAAFVVVAERTGRRY
jgi:two-component system CitB family sensor kinase